MNTYKSVTEFFNEETPKYMDYYFDMNLAVSDQIMCYLKEKGWTQKNLAKALGKKESEVSKWLSGTHNFTLKSIAKIAAIFDKEILITPLQEERKKAEETVSSLLQDFWVNTDKSVDPAQTVYEKLAGIKTSKKEVEHELEAA